MKQCDTCAHFVLLPSRLDGNGWCNAPIPLWAWNMLNQVSLSLMPASGGVGCETWEDATP